MRKLILPMPALALFSCQKESDQLTPPSISDAKKSTEELFAYEDYEEPEDIESALQDFLDDYDEQTLGYMSIEDAIWYLEGATNYANRYERFPYLETVDSTITFTYSWSSGSDFSSSQLESMMDDAQDVIDAIPSGYQFVATDFYLKDLTNSSITMAATVVAGLPSGYPPFNISGKDAEANADVACSNSGASKAAFKQVQDKAFKKYLNSLTFYPGTYIYYTSTVTFGEVGRSMSSKNLFGGSTALYASHESPVDNAECISDTEIDAYRDEVLSKVTSLGKKPFMIKLRAGNWSDPQDPSNTYGYWVYREVIVSSENVSVLAPAP